LVDNYTMKLPHELVDFLEDYIKKNPQLGYRKVSQYILHIIQDHAKKLTDFREKVSDQKTVALKQGTYTKEEMLDILKSLE